MNNNSSTTILTNYIADQLLATPPKQAVWRRALKYILIMMGMAWGVPWIWASMSAAAIFPSPLANLMAIVFAIGIVCTVGADGWWIMQEASKRLDKLSPAQKKLLSLQYGNTQHRATKTILCWLLAALSCIAPVYAAVKYSADKEPLLVIVTLVGCYSYGLIGYARLVDRCNQWWHDRHHNKILLKFKTHLVRSIYALQLSNITARSSGEWLQQWLDNSQTLAANEKTILAKKSWLQLCLTIIIPPTASLVDIFLINDFLYNHVWSNIIFTISAAIVAALPAFAINTLATYHVIGKLTQRSQQPINTIKKSSRLLYLIPTFGALLAPTAAAYITYTTLTSHHLPGTLVLFAVIAISAARILFSWFTLNSVMEQITAFTRRWIKSDNATYPGLQSRIHIFAEALNRVNPTHLAGSTD